MFRVHVGEGPHPIRVGTLSPKPSKTEHVGRIGILMRLPLSHGVTIRGRRPHEMSRYQRVNGLGFTV